MNDLFKAYLSEDERELAILESTLDRDIAEGNTLLEMTMAKHQLNMVECEHKVLTESGTFEDLETLYEAAGEETDKKTKGVIGKMIDAIVNFFSNIVERMRKMFTKETLDEAAKNGGNVELEKDPNKLVAALSGVMNKARRLVSKIRSGNKVDDQEIEGLSAEAKKMLGVAGGTVAVAAAVTGVKTLMGKQDEIKGHLESIKAEAEKMNTVDNTKVNLLKRVINVISATIKEITGETVKAGKKIVAGKKVASAKVEGNLDAAKVSKKEEPTTESGSDYFSEEVESFFESCDGTDLADIEELLAVW